MSGHSGTTPGRRFIALAIASLAVALSGCATTVFNPATNIPMTKDTPAGMDAPRDIIGENTIALSFSGGGLRAAALAHGCFGWRRPEREATLTDEIAFIPAFPRIPRAAHFGLYGRGVLSRFPKTSAARLRATCGIVAIHRFFSSSVAGSTLARTPSMRSIISLQGRDPSRRDRRVRTDIRVQRPISHPRRFLISSRLEPFSDIRPTAWPMLLRVDGRPSSSHGVLRAYRIDHEHCRPSSNESRGSVAPRSLMRSNGPCLVSARRA